MHVNVDEDGETRVRDRFLVTAPVSGRVHRIEIEPGDEVVRGKTVLARITPAESPLIDPRTRGELQAAVDAAAASVGQERAERQRATTTLERARSTLRRQQELMKAGAIASDDLEAAETALATAEDALRAAEFTERRAQSELQLARARLSAPGTSGRSVDVLSPIDGIVLKRLRESEGVVPVGEPLLEIGEPGRMEIVADLLSTDAVRVSPGAEVLVEQWGGGHTLHGRVRRVEPSGFMKVSALGVEEQRVNVIVDFTDPREAARLGDGYRVEVRVVLWKEDDVLKVPVGALFRQGEGWAVFLVEEGRVQRQTVELGQRNENDGQILSGLEAGATVVLHPPDTLTDGTRVTIRES
jgi:HlyD family secretion protein